MPRTVWVVTGSAAVVLLAAAGVGAILANTPHHATQHSGPATSTHGPTPAGPATSSPAPAVVALPSAARLRQLATELTSPQPAALADAIDPAVASALRQSGQALAPAGSTLAIDPATIRRAGPAAANVHAAVTTVGGPQRAFALLLLIENGRWVVLSSSPAS